MYVCVCRAVTEKHIETAVLGGARRLAIPGKSDILQALRIGGHLAHHEIAVQCIFQKDR